MQGCTISSWVLPEREVFFFSDKSRKKTRSEERCQKQQLTIHRSRSTVAGQPLKNSAANLKHPMLVGLLISPLTCHRLKRGEFEVERNFGGNLRCAFPPFNFARARIPIARRRAKLDLHSVSYIIQPRCPNSTFISANQFLSLFKVLCAVYDFILGP